MGDRIPQNSQSQKLKAQRIVVNVLGIFLEKKFPGPPVRKTSSRLDHLDAATQLELLKCTTAYAVPRKRHHHAIHIPAYFAGPSSCPGFARQQPRVQSVGLPEPGLL